MGERAERREAAIERMADHVLAAGLPGASLRPLAAAAGTSDRMLLYYFADKAELLAAVLARVAARLTAQLDAAMPQGPLRPYARLLEEVWAAASSDAVRPFMHVWLDVAAAASRGQQPHRAVAGAIADGFLAWLALRLDSEGEARAREAALLLATIDGLLLLDAVGRREVAARAATPLAS